MLWWLIVVDTFMSLAAFRVDWWDFFTVPWYFVPFVPICPIYPLLLAINFFIYKKRGNFNQPFLHFTAIGIIGYGIMAFLFYPSYILIKGFQWYEFGNLVWVTVYAVQIFLIWPFVKKIHANWYLLFGGYYLAKDFLDRFGETFSYQRAGEFSSTQANLFFGAIIFLHLLAIFLLTRKPKQCKFGSNYEQ